MAYDKVIDSAKLEAAITATADAIRAKTGSAEKIPWDAESGYKDAVEGIPEGGGGSEPTTRVKAFRCPEEYANAAANISTSVEAIGIEEQYWRFFKLTITDFRRAGASATYATVGDLAFYNKNGEKIGFNSSAKYSAISSTADNPADLAFDGEPATYWHSDWYGAPSTENWLQVDTYSYFSAKSFGITPRGDTTVLDIPCSFALSASYNGSDWVEIASYSDLVDGWEPGVERMFLLE